jgi:hypothetical protein
VARGDNSAAAAVQEVFRLGRAWEDLAKRFPRVAATLDLYYFGKYEVEGVALTLGRSEQTSAIDLRFGQAWLVRALRRTSAERADDKIDPTNGECEASVD